jgi:tetratricopeptide (TPR) repeat protein
LALINLGIVLSELDRRDEALTCVAEAVKLNAGLVEANRDMPASPYPSVLAHTVSNYSILLAELNDRENALSFNQTAVEMYRALAEDDPARYRPHLASALDHRSILLSELDRRDESMALSQEAEELWRLAEDNPGTPTQPTSPQH